MGAVDFLNQGNPPSCAEIGTAILDVQGSDKPTMPYRRLHGMIRIQNGSASVQEESDPLDDETDDDKDNNNSESSKSASNSDAFSALETATEWYEQQSEY
ncbi:UNVERIFIED_CONTAM: hypothetical protein NCL1_35824 [Trichonephila clavipes]